MMKKLFGCLLLFMSNIHGLSYGVRIWFQTPEGKKMELTSAKKGTTVQQLINEFVNRLGLNQYSVELDEDGYKLAPHKSKKWEKSESADLNATIKENGEVVLVDPYKNPEITVVFKVDQREGDVQAPYYVTRDTTIEDFQKRFIKSLSARGVKPNSHVRFEFNGRVLEPMDTLERVINSSDKPHNRKLKAFIMDATQASQ